ncbi:Uncharacterized protein dnm_020260 [Desulfonema magnum]|uniref:Uncharacterized protein n=1 Tax=Desulfonema magnum TaxID=45655 RepID=A0A975GMQ4_9BACT|nr:Uncharacterized protein dnm_020260 [Desulfonema magnum]
MGHWRFNSFSVNSGKTRGFSSVAADHSGEKSGFFSPDKH